ncbi:MAG: hypothetical protein RIB93_29930 [Coleofasciculus sp. D1-CHI-01]|uniref:hypothetical protein n=1 Tax=Coleofasciculus sp. D1-CHI-01 TaxID=3068482 RepID=UPI0032F59E38
MPSLTLASVHAGVVVHCEYEPNQVWCPQESSPGEAVLALLDNAIALIFRGC